MAKEISGFIKLQIKGGQANPAPPVGPALGQRGVNIMILTPRWPNAGPTGGAGFACPPLICSFINPLISFAINLPFPLGYILNQPV